MGHPVENTSSRRLDIYHLPNEILVQIISCFIPHGGLCVSNHPYHHADFATIGSLLRVGRAVKTEVLHRIFAMPLQIYITNGNQCRCLYGTKPFRETRLGKAATLPLGRFPEIVVTFAPDLLKVPCGHTKQEPWSVEFLSGDRGVRKFRSDMRCITRQSHTLAEEMIDHPDTGLEDPPRFRFRWDGTKGVDEANRSRKIPLWEVSALEWPLDKWRSVSTPITLRHNPRHQIDLPEKVVTGIVKIWKVDRDYIITGDPLDECSKVVARYWRGLWQGFRSDSYWCILHSSYHKNTVNLRFIITVRKEPGSSGAGCSYEAQYVLQQTRPP